MEHSSFWSSAKNFFFSTPITVGTEALERSDARKLSVAEAAQDTLRKLPSTTDATYFINNFGSLNLP